MLLQREIHVKPFLAYADIWMLTGHNWFVTICGKRKKLAGNSKMAGNDKNSDQRKSLLNQYMRRWMERLIWIKLMKKSYKGTQGIVQCE